MRRLEHEPVEDTDVTLVYLFQVAFADKADHLHNLDAVFTTKIRSTSRSTGTTSTSPSRLGRMPSQEG